MEKNLEQWREIAALIKMEKDAALAGFRGREFIPGPMKAPRPALRSGLRLAWNPSLMAVAASLLLAAGLISFWLLRGSWGSMASAPELGELLSDSYFYSRAGIAETAAPANVPAPAANPYFAAWIEAGLGRATAEADVVNPLTPVEHGDPVEVQRKLRRVIRENTLERLLAQFYEIHNKEA